MRDLRRKWDGMRRGKKKEKKKEEKSRSDPRYEQADNHHRSFVILLRDRGKEKKSLARIWGLQVPILVLYALVWYHSMVSALRMPGTYRYVMEQSLDYIRLPPNCSGLGGESVSSSILAYFQPPKPQNSA